MFKDMYNSLIFEKTIDYVKEKVWKLKTTASTKNENICKHMKTYYENQNIWKPS